MKKISWAKAIFLLYGSDPCQVWASKDENHYNYGSQFSELSDTGKGNIPLIVLAPVLYTELMKVFSMYLSPSFS